MGTQLKFEPDTAHRWGWVWDQDFWLLDEGSEGGIGVYTESGRGKGSSVYLSWALPLSAGGAVLAGPLPTRPPLQGRCSHLAFPGLSHAADQVHLLIPGSPTPCFARMLVERFSVSLQVIPPVHPGETVFLPRCHPLPCILDSAHLKPRSHLEGLFLR